MQDVSLAVLNRVTFGQRLVLGDDEWKQVFEIMLSIERLRCRVEQVGIQRMDDDRSFTHTHGHTHISTATAENDTSG